MNDTIFLGLPQPQEPQSVFFKLIFDSVSAHVAILDSKGMILETNAAWKRFARNNNIKMRPDTININYLDVCNTAFGDDSEQAVGVYQGIRDLIEKRIDEFVIEYPCHSPDIKRWFYMRATRLEMGDQLLIVVSHENITPLKQAQETLLRQEQMLNKKQKKLEFQTNHLEEVNTALKVLLDQREKDKIELEQRFLANIKELVFPYLDYLTNSNLDHRQAEWVQMIRSNFENVMSPFLSRLSSLEFQLTPLEVQVSTLVKQGKTTKEIAHILGSSTDAVEFHRKNIRKNWD